MKPERYIIQFWEEVKANSMPSFVYMLYDGWLMRFTEGYSRQNNSVWPLYAGKLPLAEKIAFCEAQYRARGATCAFRLTETPEHGALEALLIERGYGRSIQQGNILTIMDIWVQPNCHRQGVGRQIMQGLVQLGRRDGATITTVGVNEDNEGAP